MKLTSLLDPRPAGEAATWPMRDAVNIPLAELPDRMHELPAPGEPLELPDLPIGREAADFLAARGRTSTLVPFELRGSSPSRLWRPNPFLEATVSALNPGHALDVGCGSGRDAVYLASLGWRVTALDILPDALDRGRDLAHRYLEDPSLVEWLPMDIRRTTPTGPFDLVAMFAFLHRPLLARLPGLLTPGGSLILETFTTEHRAKHGRPASPDLAIDPTELNDLAPGLQVMQANAEWRNDRHVARLWALAPRE